MTNKLIHIPNDDTQKYPFCRLKLVVETFEHVSYGPTNQNSLKPKVFKLTNEKIIMRLWKLV